MSGGSASGLPTGPPEHAGQDVCLLLACFRGAKSAARARKTLDRQLTSGGDTVLDEVLLRVNARHRTRIYDPRRVLAGP